MNEAKNKIGKNKFGVVKTEVEKLIDEMKE